MARHDLMSLSLDDLASLTNRGTVKRAEKELAVGELKFEIKEESDGHLLVTWSDGLHCEFRAGESVHEARCSSGMLGITRHIVRSVLAYQMLHLSAAASVHADSSESPGGSVEMVARSPDDSMDRATETGKQTALHAIAQTDKLSSWDPGEIPDEALVDRFGATAIRRARNRFEEGTLVELMRGSKPFATFFDENCFIRFLVRGDLRYVMADCSEANLSRFVAMAVWAFRELSKDKEGGLLSLRQTPPEIPVATLKQLNNLLIESTIHGIARAPKALLARLKGLEEVMRKGLLVWPADLLGELSQEIQLYAQHDARFEPQRVALVVGELIARSRAIRRNVTTVPQLLIRGNHRDRPIDITSGSYVGIGMLIRPGRAQTNINAFFQDTDTGIVVTVERKFSDETERTFQELAETHLYQGTTLAGIADSQMLLKSGKRLANGELVLPRRASAFASNFQSFQWEQLKPPLAAEDFGQLFSRWAYLPPSYLRPRRRTEGVHVVAIASVKNAHFNSVQHRIEADLVDHCGNLAKLVMPFHARGAEGFNRFLEELRNRGDSANFISGTVTMANQQLIMQPLAVVLESSGTRRAIYPYWSKDRNTKRTKTKGIEETSEVDVSSVATLETKNPLKQFFDRLCHFNAEVILLGIEGGAEPNERLALELIEIANSLGFLKIVSLLKELQKELMCRKKDFRHDTRPAVRIAHQLLLIGRIEGG